MATKKNLPAKQATFDLSILDNFVAKGHTFMVDKRAEDVLIKWVQFKEMVEATDKLVRDKIKEQMEKKKVLKIEGETVKVSRRYFGERFEITDSNLALGMGVAVEEVKVKLDPKAVEKYEKENGELPECVRLKERTESVVISGLKE